MQQLRGRVPDLLDRHGLSEEVLLDRYSRPLLTAEETIFFQKDGQVKQRVNVATLGIRLSSLRTAFDCTAVLRRRIQRKQCSMAWRSFEWIYHAQRMIKR